jgi:hypothetical protein
MKAICSSETSVDTQRTTRRYIPEDGTLDKISIAKVQPPTKIFGTTQIYQGT